jgi:hypothetical protein
MEISAMRHHDTVFHELLKHVPWHRFDRLVEEHGADARVRRLSTKGQFVALLYGQLSGAASLREIVTGLSSHSARLYHLGAGADPVRRSTFSDANAQRPVAVFTELLEIMMKQAHRGLRRKLAETTYLIDATSARLNERSAGWARFSAGVCGAKVHVIYDADADRPIYAAVSAANINDITAARQMPIEPGATYIFDLGYYDYSWWAELDAVGCRIVTGSSPIRRSRWWKSCWSRQTVTSCPIASVSFLHARPGAVVIQCRRRCARSALRPIPARCCASCRTISMPALKKSPIFIADVGPSSCSSAG